MTRIELTSIKIPICASIKVNLHPASKKSIKMLQSERERNKNKGLNHSNFIKCQKKTIHNFFLCILTKKFKFSSKKLENKIIKLFKSN